MRRCRGARRSNGRSRSWAEFLSWGSKVPESFDHDQVRRCWLWLGLRYVGSKTPIITWVGVITAGMTRTKRRARTATPLSSPWSPTSARHRTPSSLRTSLLSLEEEMFLLSRILRLLTTPSTRRGATTPPRARFPSPPHSEMVETIAPGPSNFVNPKPSVKPKLSVKISAEMKAAAASASFLSVLVKGKRSRLKLN